MERSNSMSKLYGSRPPITVPIDPGAVSFKSSTSGIHNSPSYASVVRKWVNYFKTNGTTVITYLIHLRRRVLFKLTRLQKAFVICILLLVTAFSLYSQLLTVTFAPDDDRPGVVQRLPARSDEERFRIQEELDAVAQPPALWGENSSKPKAANKNRIRSIGTIVRADHRFAVQQYQQHPAAGPPVAIDDWRTRFTGPKNARQKAVVSTFQRAWRAYKESAWGEDELLPISRGSRKWFGLGLQILDATDTIIIMGLSDEYGEARAWIDKSLSFDIDSDVNLFECTIRALAGLLSAYHLTHDQMFLTKAVDLGDRLLGAFTASSHVVPYSDVNLRSRKAHSPAWGSDSSTSEVSTIQIELRELTMLTGDQRFTSAADGVSQHLHSLPKPNGLVPIFISPQTGQFQTTAAITLGARGDSYYEYLLKQYLHLGGKVDAAYMLNDYLEAMEGVKSLLYKYTAQNRRGFVGELIRNNFSPKMDHLVCFLPGLLALGVWSNVTMSTSTQAEHMQMAEELMRTCYEMYNSTQSGLAPEITYFETDDASKPDMRINPNDAHYLLRPETVESLFYMWRITRNVTYQDWAWNIYKAIERGCRLDKSQTANSSGASGYASVHDVRVEPSALAHRDRMETFFLGETLKYLYLIFDAADGPLVRALPLDEYVFNTEAHLLPIRRQKAA